MILHPLALSLLATDLTALALLAAASASSVRVVLGYRPGAADRAQLLLERRAEVAALEARGAAWLMGGLGTALFVVALVSVLPRSVPGAMCGTGVLEGMGPAGPRALVFRGLALALFAARAALDRLDRTRPEAPLATASARATLIALPVAALAALETGAALVALDPAAPVDCCAVAYDAVRTARAAAVSGGRPPWLAIVGLGGAALTGLGLLAAGRRGRAGRAAPALLLAAALVLVPLLALGLTRQLAAYHYGVLAHDCPFCLFAPRHRLVGYPLFGGLLLVLLEALAAAVARGAAAREPLVEEGARARVRAAGLRVAVAAALFTLLATGPAFAYRVAHGVWIDG